MSFSYNAVWEDTLKLTRERAPLLVAIAGVFIFLPALLLIVLLPPPEPATSDPERMMQIVMDYYAAAAPWYLVQTVFSMIGAAAMLRLVFARETTVAAALVFGLTLLPFYLLMTLLSGIVVGLGFILLIVPGLYLFGRLAPAPAVMVAESRRNPLDAIGRSFAITKGRGWAVFGMIFIVAIIGGLATGIARTLFGIVFTLAAGQDLGKLLTNVVGTALSAALATVLLMLYAAIYRALTPETRVAETFA